MNNKMPEEEAIKILGLLLEEVNKTALSDQGACVYDAGSGTYCAQLTKPQCDVLKGIWTAGGKCPG
jgi:hypothetical protein